MGDQRQGNDKRANEPHICHNFPHHFPLSNPCIAPITSRPVTADVGLAFRPSLCLFEEKTGFLLIMTEVTVFQKTEPGSQRPNSQ